MNYTRYRSVRNRGNHIRKMEIILQDVDLYNNSILTIFNHTYMHDKYYFFINALIIIFTTNIIITFECIMQNILMHLYKHAIYIIYMCTYVTLAYIYQQAQRWLREALNRQSCIYKCRQSCINTVLLRLQYLHLSSIPIYVYGNVKKTCIYNFQGGCKLNTCAQNIIIL